MATRRFPRQTRQRTMILEELRHLACHPTAVGLYDRVRVRLPRISLGTVYRNLELLAEMGLIRKIQVAGAETRFDGNLTQHDHIRCMRCGRVDDVAGVSLDCLGAKGHDSGGYQIVGYRLELLGICPACQTTAAH